MVAGHGSRGGGPSHSPLASKGRPQTSKPTVPGGRGMMRRGTGASAALGTGRPAAARCRVATTPGERSREAGRSPGFTPRRSGGAEAKAAGGAEGGSPTKRSWPPRGEGSVTQPLRPVSGPESTTSGGRKRNRVQRLSARLNAVCMREAALCERAPSGVL